MSGIECDEPSGSVVSGQIKHILLKGIYIWLQKLRQACSLIASLLTRPVLMFPEEAL
jgi:hypothetical protein